MRRALACLFLVFCTPVLVFCTPVFASDADIKSLTYVRWVDIGVPGGMVQMNPAQIAKLRKRCENWSMYFTSPGVGIAQIFVAGMTMTNVFPKVLVSHLEGETIFILVPPGREKTHDTLHLSKDGVVLTQFSPPFRPHTYLRCVDAPVKK